MSGGSVQPTARMILGGFIKQGQQCIEVTVASAHTLKALQWVGFSLAVLQNGYIIIVRICCTSMMAIFLFQSLLIYLLGSTLGTAPPQYQFILRVLLMTIYNHIIILVIQPTVTEGGQYPRSTFHD